MSEVFAFEYSDCTYESAYGVESLHATKRGAYEAMRRKIVADAEDARQSRLRYGDCYRRGDKSARFAAWRVRRIEVLA